MNIQSFLSLGRSSLTRFKFASQHFSIRRVLFSPPQTVFDMVSLPLSSIHALSRFTKGKHNTVNNRYSSDAVLHANSTFVLFDVLQNCWHFKFGGSINCSSRDAWPDALCDTCLTCVSHVSHVKQMNFQASIFRHIFNNTISQPWECQSNHFSKKHRKYLIT